jgi:hypothetical protein
MIEDFVVLQQRIGSKSCVPTAIRSILQYRGVHVSQDQVSVWCGESRDGCWIDLAMDGLRQADIDVRELTNATIDDLFEVVNHQDDPQPILVTIQDPFSDSYVDHAVVVVEVTKHAAGATYENVAYMDPLTGSVVLEEASTFLQQWEFANNRAFVIEP